MNGSSPEACARHDYEQEIIEADERRRHEAGECDGAPLCGYCLDAERRSKPMNLKIIPRCSCGEPVSEGLTLCDRCVAEVNKKAKATMNVVIEALGLK